MKKRRNLLVVVLSVCILMSIVGMSLASILATDSSEQTQSVSSQESTESPNDLDGLIEEVDKRQINSKHYLDPVNKLNKAIIDMKPIHYKDNKGKWQDIVLELKESNDPQFSKEYHQGDISIKLSEKSRLQDMVSIKNKDKEITFAPIDDSSVDETLPKNVNKYLQTPNGAFGTRAANFENVYQDIDFRYELKQDALKEIIYINKPTTKNVFKFLIKANGLDAKLNSDNSVSFTDSQTNSLFFDIQKSFATDSSNKPEVYKDLTTAIEKQGSHYILTLTLDPTWLSDPERVYPIIIDPTTKYYIQGYTDADSGYGDMTGKAAKVYQYSPTINYRDDNLSVGENASGYDWNMYVQVNPTLAEYTLLSDKRILSAEQELYMYGQSDTSGRTIIMYKLTETWGEGSITWNDTPTHNSTSIASASTGTPATLEDWKTWNITSTFNSWQSSPTSNHGLLIKIDNNNYNQYKQFYGDEYEVGGNRSAKRPRLTVKYTEPPVASISSPTGDQWTTDSTPTFNWTFTDPDGDAQNKYQVQASQSSNFSTLAFDTGAVTSSAKAYTPTTPLADGTYYWRVKVYDSYDWSGWTSSASNNGKFKVDTTAPTAGTVKVNNDESYTNRQDVIMSSSASDNFGMTNGSVRFSNTTSFTGSWSLYATTKSYNLPTGDGSKTVYAQYRDAAGNVSSTANDQINLETGKQAGVKGFWSYKDVAGLKVNLQTGNLIHGGTDVSIPGRGPNLSLSRTYNSLSDSSDSTYGHKWSVSPSMRIIETSGYTKLIEGDGSEYVFIPSSGNTYKSPPGDFRKLVKNGSGNFTLTNKDQTKFNIVSNLLSTIVDSNSNTMTISYDDSNKITNLTDASGRGLTLAYDANGRLKNTIDPANRVTTYSYDTSGRLTSVINPNNETVSYSYNAQNQLTDVTKPMGATIHITYTNNKVTRISIPSQPVANINFLYNENNQVNISDPNSNVYTYSLNDTGQTISVIEPMGASPDPDVDDPNTPNIDESESEPNFPDDESIEESAIVDYTTYWNTLTNAFEKRINEYTPPTGGQTITNNYDSNFNLIKEIHKDGSSTSFSYDANGNNLTVRDRVGFTTSYSYDTYNNLLTSTTPAGDTSTNSYDQAARNLLSSTDAEGNKTTYGYDSRGNRIWEVAPEGNASGVPDEYKTSFIYDPSGNYLVRVENPIITNPDGTTTQEIYASSYSIIGNKLTDVDGAGNTTYYEYDNVGRLISARRPTYIDESPTISYVKSFNTYDANGNKIKEETLDENTGEVVSRTEYVYNSAGQKLSEKIWNEINNPTNISITSFTYDANGNVLTEEDAEEGVTSNTFDSLNRNTKSIFPDESYIAFKYDSSDSTVKEGNEEGTKVTLYNKNEAQVATSNPEKNTSISIKDSENNDVKMVDENNNVSSLNYDSNNNIVNIMDPEVTKTSYSYKAKKLSKVIFNDQTNGLQSSVSYSYAPLGKVQQTTDQLAESTNFNYNIAAKASVISQPNGADYKIEFMPNSTIKKITALGMLANSTNVSYKYDAAGNQIKATSTNAQSGVTVARLNAKYNSAKKPTELNDRLGVTISFSYNKAGNQTKIGESISGGSGDIDFVYASKKLRDINFKNNTIASHIYTTSGLQKRVTLANGIVTSISYDKASQVKSFKNHRSGVIISSYAYVYDKTGNKTSITEPDGTSTYKYDKLNRLERVINKDNTRVTYSYDTLGNRKTKADSTGTTSYSYNNANQLVSLIKPNVETITYKYDKNGNTTQAFSTTNATTSYSYNNFNDLIKIVKPNGDIIEFVYDGRGNRYSKTVTPSGGNPVSTYYQYDNQGNIVLETDASKNIKVKYIRDNSGKALAMEQNNQMYYFVYNGHGDITSVTDSSGNTVATYTYDEFGNLKSSSESIYNPLRYAAGYNAYFDAETSLYKMGARYYNPEIGRWITRDLMNGSKTQIQTQNKYLYVENNPISAVDPTGFCSEKDPKAYAEWTETWDRYSYLVSYYSTSIFGELHKSITKNIRKKGLLDFDDSNLWWNYENALIISDMKQNIRSWSSVKNWINNHKSKSNRHDRKEEGKKIWWTAHNKSMEYWNEHLQYYYVQMPIWSSNGAGLLMYGAKNYTLFENKYSRLYPWDPAQEQIAEWLIL